MINNIQVNATMRPMVSTSTQALRFQGQPTVQILFGQDKGKNDTFLHQAQTPSTPSEKPSAPRLRPQPKLPQPIDLEELKQRIKTTGLEAHLHGANHDSHIYVLTYRNPNNFFDSVEYSLVPGNKETAQLLKTLNRHDKIRVKGEFINYSTPQGHVRADEIQVLEKWTGPNFPTTGADHHTVKLPADLKGKDELIGMVHAIHGDGQVMVLEYKHTVVPVVVPDKSLTQGVWRGDKIKMRFSIQQHPKSPAHLVLNPDTSNGQQPLVVLDRIRNMHGKLATLEGNLVLFPKSPMINRDIWALEQNTGDETRRYFTIFNFNDMGDQALIDNAFRTKWEAEKAAIMDARNKFVNPKIRIRVTGMVNDQSPNQANPQIIPNSKDVTIL